MALVLLGGCAAAVLLGAPAQAWSCVEVSEADYRRSSLLIFEGVVVTTGWAPFDPGPVEYATQTFRVTKYLKGAGAEMRTVHAGGGFRTRAGPPANGDDPVAPRLGERWRIYVRSKAPPGGPMSAGPCSGSFDLRYRDQVLGGRDGLPESKFDESSGPKVGIGLAAVIGVASMFAIRRWRRRSALIVDAIGEQGGSVGADRGG